MITVEPVVDMHNTWLCLNSVQGCTNGCKYCFLQGINHNTAVSKVIVSAEEGIEMLINSKYYDPRIPICLFPGTDIFLNENNINYLKRTLNIIYEKGIKNTLVIITKCYIPSDVINLFKKMIENGNQVIVYLSYSGLSREYEPSINHDNIRENFRRLKENNIKVVHYYRPFLKENSSKEKISEMLKFVSQYTNVSVVTGLQVRKDFIDKIDFEEIKKLDRDECLKASSVWPKEAYDYFYKEYNGNHNFFQSNSCALAEVLNEPCSLYYDTFECHNYNHCSKEQRQRCESNQKRVISDEEILNKISKLDIDISDIKIIRKDNNIILVSDKLGINDVAYLTNVLQTKISLAKANKKDSHFNSFMTNSKPYIY